MNELERENESDRHIEYYTIKRIDDPEALLARLEEMAEEVDARVKDNGGVALKLKLPNPNEEYRHVIPYHVIDLITVFRQCNITHRISNRSGDFLDSLQAEILLEEYKYVPKPNLYLV
ncbi:hypothetical protein [Parendozoicomonas haliclonae]|uniref:Uncharacterized protein n=1 Tax=Parendozoicomonas haliclonae TaxID=1960125 RepID=A0A1X7ARR0_9GAMM|nr:hypothetical protein [Parendozoicomonas haliclonae]SMA50779.1 hypothetical protein EHSB41UT_04596 [Parendozoicomonas haliclonae]